MKWLKYLYNGVPVCMSWNEDSERIAKEEADNGEYTVEDDGLGDAEPISQEERINELEEALMLLLSGVTE